MRKVFTILTALLLCFATQAFADDAATASDDMSSKECGNIAKACSDAGFVRGGAAGKMFWMDCMWPVLLGKSVSGVTVDSADVTSCRTFKISKMQDELKQLQQVNPTNP